MADRTRKGGGVGWIWWAVAGLFVIFGLLLFAFWVFTPADEGVNPEEELVDDEQTHAPARVMGGIARADQVLTVVGVELADGRYIVAGL